LLTSVSPDGVFRAVEATNSAQIQHVSDIIAHG